ncbi:hypothetical protein A0J61_00232 [Choanephora cucurbitarum]|uniref:Uncharacterized protein n=1 Tax=Choanephora cucurbitarum TaxID=101091 RepID=A0A1C7NSR1_9FUNG|nr:hypothetical protein A0J61_00232 [Choanephora cucurbitarum]
MPEDIILVGAETAHTDKLMSTLVIDQRIRSISIAPFNIQKDSMRVWLRQFERLARLLGIDDMDSCIGKLSSLMPESIRSFVYGIHSTPQERTWKRTAEALLHVFAMPEERENQILELALIKCRQGPKESVQEYNARWFGHAALLASSCFKEHRYKLIYIKGLRYEFLRISLALYLETHPEATLSDMAGKANTLEWDHINRQEDLCLDVDNENEQGDTDNKSVALAHENAYTEHNEGKRENMHEPNDATQTSDSHGLHTTEPPRLYDKMRRPICGYCQGKHRNIDCKQQTKPSSSTVKNNQDGSNEALTGTVSPRIELVSNFGMGDQKVRALWGTAYKTSAICYRLAKEMKLKIKPSTVPTFRDHQNSVLQCKGTAMVSIYGEEVCVYVLKNMSCDIILGWNLMHHWQAVISTQPNIITIKTKESIQSIQYKVATLASTNTDEY